MTDPVHPDAQPTTTPPESYTPRNGPPGMDRAQAAVHCVVALCVLVLGLVVTGRPQIQPAQITFAYWCLGSLLLTSGVIKLAEIISLRSPAAGRLLGPGSQVVLASMAALAALHVL